MKQRGTFFLLIFIFCVAISSSYSSSNLSNIRNQAVVSEGLVRPLPLAGHWNRGENPRGFTPAYQLHLLKNGHHILPWFHFNVPDSITIVPYYEKLLKFASEHKLPISFVGTQWERLLTSSKYYYALSPYQNPNVFHIDGSIHKKVSPFGPVAPWHEVGSLWTTQQIMKKLQEWYPDPPLVLFVSNNEHTLLEWHEVEESQRYIQQYGLGRSDEFKRKVVGDGWIERYGALFDGMRDGLSATDWKSNSRFIGYNAFPDGSFWRWGGWPKYALHMPGRFEPWSHVWDGASIPYYTHDWDPSVDFTVNRHGIMTHLSQ